MAHKAMPADVLMQALKHLRAQNPIYPQFQPMQLYEKVAVRRCQIPHHGKFGSCMSSCQAILLHIQLYMCQMITIEWS